MWLDNVRPIKHINFCDRLANCDSQIQYKMQGQIHIGGVLRVVQKLIQNGYN